MGIIVQVDGKERRWGEIGSDWIAQQITGRRNDGCDVCTRIRVEEAGATWSTANCPSGSGKAPSGPLVDRINAVYSKFDLDEKGYSPGNVIAFIQQIERLL